MKKIFTLFVALVSLMAVRAEMTIFIDGELVSGDTTIVVTDFEEDVLGDIEMGWVGSLTGYKSKLYVDVQRTAGVVDELCVGECKPGTGAANQTFEFDLAVSPKPLVSIYAHYYPVAPGRETIVYTFRGDCTRTITVHYDYMVSGVSAQKAHSQSTKVVRNGQIVILRDGVEYNLLGAKL